MKKSATENQLTVARMLKRLRAGADVRKKKVRRVKLAVRRDAYVNLLKLDVAADRLARHLVGEE